MEYYYTLTVLGLFISIIVLIYILTLNRRLDADNKKISHMLYYDGLTGLLNRKGFVETVDKLMKKNDDKQYAIIYFNIKDFKVINELFGISGGNTVLAKTAMMLNSSKVRPVVCGRVEADHFVMCIEQKDIDIEELINICMQQYIQDDKVYRFYSRFGIYCVEDKSMNVNIMCDRAKLAKQFIKDDYVKPYAFYEDYMGKQFVEERALISDMKSSLIDGQFQVYLQPIYDVKSETIASAEALIRWIHPELGFLSPGIFVPVFERNGCITELDKFVLKSVIDMQKERLNTGKKIIPIAINLSRMDFYVDNLEEDINTNLEENNGLEQYIRLEVTESTYADAINNIQRIIQNMQEKGVKILLDDFGSGYSTFSSLYDCQFDIIKLDMGFVRKIKTDKKAEIIIEYIIKMAHGLGVQVIAEGAETKEQVEFLKNANCDFIQGYYYAKPMKRYEFEELLRA